jgi:tetratricopeptide (TPR) repeat protein
MASARDYKKEALLFLQNGQYQKAEKAFKKVSQEAKDATYYSGLGFVLSCQEKYKEAKTAFEEALKIEPNNKHHLGDLAATLFEKGECLAALVVLKKIGTIPGTDTPPIYNNEQLRKFQKGAQSELDQIIKYSQKASPSTLRDVCTHIENEGIEALTAAEIATIHNYQVRQKKHYGVFVTSEYIVHELLGTVLRFLPNYPETMEHNYHEDGEHKDISRETRKAAHARREDSAQTPLLTEWQQRVAAGETSRRTV